MTADEEKEMLHRMRMLRIPGFTQTYLEQKDHEPDYADIPFEDRLKEMVDAAWHLRVDNRTAKLIHEAKLVMPEACFEEVDYGPERSFDVRTFRSLQNNNYLNAGFHVIIAGAVGSGKTYLSNALAVNACRDAYKVRFFRTSDLFGTFHENSSADFSAETFREVCSCKLLILDEFLLTPIAPEDVRLLFEIVSRRSQQRRSMIFCSHYTPDGWYERLGADPLAESILDRVLPSAHKIFLDSVVSMRDKYENLTQESMPVSDTKAES